MQRGQQCDYWRTFAEKNAAEGGKEAQGKVVSDFTVFFPQLWLTVSANTSPDDSEWDIFGISIYSACCVTVVIMDQILDHSVWINTDILWGESTEGLWEETCKFDS